ncbi:MAG: hypothetical protein P8Y53_13415 [Pseudolabrys sp.]
MRRSDVTVVKLGGSQSGSAHLRGWLKALAECGGRVVVVPGGGPFADAVRMAQLKMGLGDAVAHHMALLAMEQYGRALASLAPGIHVAGTIAEIRSALRARQVPVWAPVQMALKAADIPANLVKLGGPYEGRLRVQKLAAAGVVDQAFPYFLAQSEAQGRIVAATDHAAADAIRDGSEIGARIDLHERDGRRLTPRRWPRSRHRAGAGR